MLAMPNTGGVKLSRSLGKSMRPVKSGKRSGIWRLIPPPLPHIVIHVFYGNVVWRTLFGLEHDFAIFPKFVAVLLLSCQAVWKKMFQWEQGRGGFISSWWEGYNPSLFVGNKSFENRRFQNTGRGQDFLGFPSCSAFLYFRVLQQNGVLVLRWVFRCNSLISTEFQSHPTEGSTYVWGVKRRGLIRTRRRWFSNTSNLAFRFFTDIFVRSFRISNYWTT